MEVEEPIIPISYADEWDRAWMQYEEREILIEHGGDDSDRAWRRDPLLEACLPENWDDIRTGDGIISDGLKYMKVGQEKEIIGLKKKLILEGQGNYDATPDVGDEVEVYLTRTLVDGTVFGSTGHFIYKLENEEVIGGLDRAVMTMKKGEVAQFAIAPEYAFGSFQPYEPLTGDAPNSSLYYYHVELVSFLTEKESYVLNTPKKINDHLVVEGGNQLSKEEKYVKAIRRYEKAAKYARELQLIQDPTSMVRGIKTISNFTVISCCDMILEAEPENVRALYKRASSYLYVNELGSAESDFKEVLRIEPTNWNAQIKFRIVDNTMRKRLLLIKKRQQAVRQIFEENRRKTSL